MQALILATSETEKLSPLSEATPTGMLPLLSRPIMVGAIEQLAYQGIKRVIVSLYHLPGSIEAYFGNGERWNLALEYVLQKDKWGSAGALKWAENLLTESFLVLPADQVFELDIQALHTWHLARQSQVTVVIPPRGNGSGIVMDHDGRVTDIHSEAPLATGASTGIYLFEPEILTSIPPRTVFDIATDLLPQLVQQGVPVYGYTLSDFWHPIHTFKDFQAAHWEYLNHLETVHPNNPHPIRPDLSLRARPIAPGIWVGRNTLIHPTAKLSPPVFIGENSSVGRDVSLGPETMLGTSVLVDDGATIANSSILDNTYVGQYVNVKNSIASAELLIDVETGESISIVDQFLLSEARTFATGGIFESLLDRAFAALLLIALSPFLVLFGLVAFISTKKVFSHLTHIGSRTSSASLSNLNHTFREFSLVRFSTRLINDQETLGGKWLEQWEFHRLPELWNVVIGDLRLIGVKPLSRAEAGKIVEKWQQKRYEYASGFTGLWYLQMQPEGPLDDILITDAYYVATRTWREDLRILWQTIPTWWKHVTKKLVR